MMVNRLKMSKGVSFVLLLSAQCLTMVASARMPKLLEGEVLINASYAPNLKQTLQKISKTAGVASNNGNGPSCPGCSAGKREEDLLHIEIFKTKLLNRLDMKAPPTGRMSNKFLISQIKRTQSHNWQQQNSEPVEDKIAETLQIMVIGEKVRSSQKGKIRKDNKSNKSPLLSFTFTSKVYMESIANVQLWIHKRSKVARQKCTLIIKDHDSPTQMTRTLKPGEKGWIALDLTNMVRKWVRDDYVNSQGGNASSYRHIIQINCADCDSAKKVIHFSADRYRPFLSIFPDTSNTRRRKKRSTNCVVGQKGCCLQPLRIDFKQLGWDKWIIIPEYFNANYCRGSCNRHILPRWGHTNVLQMIGNKNITQCCAPSKLSGLSMLYFDNNDTIIKKDLENLKVEECMCA